jgi:hypothetical protein
MTPLGFLQSPLHQTIQHSIPQQLAKSSFVHRKPRQRPPGTTSVMQRKHHLRRGALSDGPCLLLPRRNR